MFVVLDRVVAEDLEDELMVAGWVITEVDCSVLCWVVEGALIESSEIGVIFILVNGR